MLIIQADASQVELMDEIMAALESLGLVPLKLFRFFPGDCFWDALSALISPSEPQVHSLKLRRHVVSWLVHALLEEEDWATLGPTLNQLSSMASLKGSAPNLRSYLDGMRRSAKEEGLWADHATANLACQALGFNLKIYKYDMTSVSLNSYDSYAPPVQAGSPPTPTAHLFFQGGTDGGHYIPLVSFSDMVPAPLSSLLPQLASRPLSLKKAIASLWSGTHLPVLMERVSTYAHAESSRQEECYSLIEVMGKFMTAGGPSSAPARGGEKRKLEGHRRKSKGQVGRKQP